MDSGRPQDYARRGPAPEFAGQQGQTPTVHPGLPDRHPLRFKTQSAEFGAQGTRWHAQWRKIEAEQTAEPVSKRAEPQNEELSVGAENPVGLADEACWQRPTFVGMPPEDNIDAATGIGPGPTAAPASVRPALRRQNHDLRQRQGRERPCGPSVDHDGRAAAQTATEVFDEPTLVNRESLFKIQTPSSAGRPLGNPFW